MYFSEKTVQLCHDKKLFFICRIKSNSKYLNIYDDSKITIGNKQKLNLLDFNDYIRIMNNGNKIRILTFNKNNKARMHSILALCHVATNIFNKEKYDINFFIHNYSKRWDIETVFRTLKCNSSLDNLKIKQKEKIKKEIESINIITLLCNYILCLYSKYDNLKKKINKKTFMCNFYKYLLVPLVIGNLKENKFKKIMDIIIIFIINKDQQESHPRISIMPYSKWHYKCKFKLF